MVTINYSSRTVLNQFFRFRELLRRFATREEAVYIQFICIFAVILVGALPIIAAHDVANISHFSSSMCVFEHVSSRGFQFGTDFIDNIGPVGYLHYPYVYCGGVYWGKIGFYIVVSAAYSFFATKLALRITSLLGRIAFVSVCMLFATNIAFPWYSYEYLPRLVIFFSASSLLLVNRAISRRLDMIELPFIAILLAFLSLEKATNVFYIGFVVIVLTVYWVVNRTYSKVIWLAGSPSISFRGKQLTAGIRM